MKREKIIHKLDRIEDAIRAKGHPMQDYSTVKTALIEIIGVIRQMQTDAIARKAGAKRRNTKAS